jgi:hypothetical protein
MTGSFAAAVQSVILVAASGIWSTDGKLGTFWTATCLAISAYIFLLFAMAIRRMYSAYLRVFEGGQYLHKPRKNSELSNRR